MSRRMWLIALMAGAVGVSGHFLIEDWKKALGFVIVASALDIFWDIIITAYEKRAGEID